jgi:hypothetical protein
LNRFGATGDSDAAPKQPLRTRSAPNGYAAYSSSDDFFLPPDLAFLAAVLARFASSAARTLRSISVIAPPAFSMAARAEAVA